MTQRLALFLPIALFISCGSNNGPNETISSQSEEFSQYWNQGQAEISTFKLSQARYGETHKGTAVLVFVTEDFSKQKQVKLDYPISNENDRAPVLKLNQTRKFNTGVYPYSMMTSVFTPTNDKIRQSSLKITTTSQEWCGHTFTQLNLRKNGYEVNLYSYFESEGDQNFSLGADLLEDELWNLIRINPDLIPQGEIKITPSTIHQRLRHNDLKSEKATLKIIPTGNNLNTLHLKYATYDRELKIDFNSTFPFEIMAWKETYKSGFGPNAKSLTTYAELDKIIQLDYWSKNSIKDSVYRKMLNLD
ncbi:MAG: hypothetical protein ACJATA_000916 [Sphingobacteriales bacterium]|jgi:hypothetical protein